MADESQKANLSQLSWIMVWLSTAGTVLLPLAVIATFLLPDIGYGLGNRWNDIPARVIGETPFDYRLVAFVFALVPTAFTIWALWSLRQLFLLYAGGEVFSHHALRMLNHVAVALFAGVITDIVTQAPITLLLSWYKGHGHRALSIGIGSHEIAGLFVAGAVLVVARVMAEARRMADENAGFV